MVGFASPVKSNDQTRSRVGMSAGPEATVKGVPQMAGDGTATEAFGWVGWVGRLIGVFAVSAVMSGCQDPNRMFFGLWETEEALPEGWLEGRPELAVGQYGTELTGVVRYLDSNGLPTLPCRCAFLDHQRVDLDGERFVAVSEQCDESLWIWDLSLVEDEDPPVLEGTVTRANLADQPVAVRFVLVDRFVPGERRVCEP